MTCIISHINISGRIKSKPTRIEDYSRWQESNLQSDKRFKQISVLLVHQLMDKTYSSSSRSSCTSSICMSQVVHKDGMMSKLWLVEVIKECVLKSCLGRDALCRVDLQHALQFKFHPSKLWYSQFSHLSHHSHTTVKAVVLTATRIPGLIDPAYKRGNVTYRKEVDTLRI